MLQKALQDVAPGTHQTKAIRVLISYPAVPNVSLLDSVEAGEYPCSTVRLDEIVGEGNNRLHQMLKTLESAVANRIEHGKNTRAMKKTIIDSKRKSTAADSPGSSATGSSRSSKRKKRTPSKR